jgi:hypothetical protein
MIKGLNMIKVNVLAPKKIAGSYNFGDFKEFYQWMDKVKQFKNLKAKALVSLAQNGSYNAFTDRYSISCSYDRPLGYKAKEIAREIGFLKTKMGSDVGYNLLKAHEYIKHLESLS